MLTRSAYFLFFGLLLGLPTDLSAQTHLFTFPSSLTLCGEPVPLNDRKAWEMMDREFTMVVYDSAQVYLWLKRSSR